MTPVQPDPLRTDEADAPAGGTLPDPDLDEVMEPEGPATGPTFQETTELTVSTSSRGNVAQAVMQVATPLLTSGRRVAKWRVSTQPDKA